ncbi:hypothetical protein HFD91_11630 [Enterobacteriaceae bacterium EKM102V]|nr:hypothetical protein HFD91_11630 [Enterobacteriaceae bacterium EKM102V]KAF6669511.1 hypothetical protein HFD97_06380 [Pantoea sp. EKM103V]
MVNGNISICNDGVKKWHLVKLGDEGDQIHITAQEDTVFYFQYAEPFNEPVVIFSPSVMNTLDDIQQAFADYRSGSFNLTLR